VRFRVPLGVYQRALAAIAGQGGATRRYWHALRGAAGPQTTLLAVFASYRETDLALRLRGAAR